MVANMLLRFGFVAVLALAAGIWIGRQSVTSSADLEDASDGIDRRGTSQQAGYSDLRARLAVQAAMSMNKLQRATGEPLSSTARDTASNPSRSVQHLLNAMSDQDLRSILLTSLHLTTAELEEIRDLRGFTQRIATTAMDDVIEPPRIRSGQDHVRFATSAEASDLPSNTQVQFNATTKKIYAIFPTPDLTHDQVMVKWYRRDQPEILLLRRYPVVRQDQYGHVWFDPDADWEPGEYRVDVYSADEDVTPLASGDYTIR